MQTARILFKSFLVTGFNADDVHWMNELMIMYIRFCFKQKWEVQPSIDEKGVIGLRITGEAAYDLLIHEQGLHYKKRHLHAKWNVVQCVVLNGDEQEKEGVSYEPLREYRVRTREVFDPTTGWNTYDVESFLLGDILPFIQKRKELAEKTK